MENTQKLSSQKPKTDKTVLCAFLPAPSSPSSFLSFFSCSSKLFDFKNNSFLKKCIYRKLPLFLNMFHWFRRDYVETLCRLFADSKSWLWWQAVNCRTWKKDAKRRRLDEKCLPKTNIKEELIVRSEHVQRSTCGSPVCSIAFQIDKQEKFFFRLFPYRIEA